MMLNEKITQLHSNLEKHKKVQYVKLLLQKTRSAILKTNSEIQAMVDSGSFDVLDPEIKTVLAAGWNICKIAQTGFENAEIAELLDWKPQPPQPPVE